MGGDRSYPRRAENLVCSLLSQLSSHLLVCAEHTGSGSTALWDDTCHPRAVGFCPCICCMLLLLPSCWQTATLSSGELVQGHNWWNADQKVMNDDFIYWRHCQKLLLFFSSSLNWGLPFRVPFPDINWRRVNKGMGWAGRRKGRIAAALSSIQSVVEQFCFKTCW